jgi:hypothetical protein
MWDLTVPGNNDHDFYVLASVASNSSMYYVATDDTPVLAHNMNPAQGPDGCGIGSPSDIGFPRFPARKTASTGDGGSTFNLSGWSKRISSSFTRIPEADAAAARQAVGLDPVSNGNDLGVTGRYYDMHAEWQSYVSTSSDRYVVSRDPCWNCQEKFTAAAVESQGTLMISSPSGLWAFYPTGDMEFVPRPPYAPLEPLP